MAKIKGKFPKKVFVFHATDIGDDPILICAESPDAISEEYSVKVVGVYELVEIGKFKVEKTISSKFDKKKLIDLDNASHSELVALAKKIGLKLHTKAMSTKELRKALEGVAADG